MVSFQRIESMLSLSQKSYRYKIIYSFKDIYCILWTNHKNHVQWTDAYFRFLYHRENDSTRLIKLLNRDQFWVHSWADSDMFQKLYQHVREYLAQSLGYEEEKIERIDCDGGTLVYYPQKNCSFSLMGDFVESTSLPIHSRTQRCMSRHALSARSSPVHWNAAGSFCCMLQRWKKMGRRSCFAGTKTLARRR